MNIQKETHKKGRALSRAQKLSYSFEAKGLSICS